MRISIRSSVMLVVLVSLFFTAIPSSAYVFVVERGETSIIEYQISYSSLEIVDYEMDGESQFLLFVGSDDEIFLYRLVGDSVVWAVGFEAELEDFSMPEVVVGDNVVLVVAGELVVGVNKESGELVWSYELEVEVGEYEFENEGLQMGSSAVYYDGVFLIAGPVEYDEDDESYQPGLLVVDEYTGSVYSFLTIGDVELKDFGDEYPTSPLITQIGDGVFALVFQSGEEVYVSAIEYGTWASIEWSTSLYVGEAILLDALYIPESNLLALVYKPVEAGEYGALFVETLTGIAVLDVRVSSGFCGDGSNSEWYNAVFAYYAGGSGIVGQYAGGVQVVDAWCNTNSIILVDLWGTSGWIIHDSNSVTKLVYEGGVVVSYDGVYAYVGLDSLPVGEGEGIHKDPVEDYSYSAGNPSVDTVDLVFTYLGSSVEMEKEDVKVVSPPLMTVEYTAPVVYYVSVEGDGEGGMEIKVNGVEEYVFKPDDTEVYNFEWGSVATISGFITVYSPSEILALNVSGGAVVVELSQADMVAISQEYGKIASIVKEDGVVCTNGCNDVWIPTDKLLVFDPISITIMPSSPIVPGVALALGGEAEELFNPIVLVPPALAVVVLTVKRVIMKRRH